MVANDAWRMLGSPSSQRLLNARVQLHWAAQVVSAVGEAEIDRRPGDDQATLSWLDDLGALASHSTPAGYQAALRFMNLSLLLLDQRGAIIDEYALPARTLDDAFAWLSDAITKHAGLPPEQPLQLPAYDMPAHAVEQGEAFSLLEVAAYDELARWFADAHRCLAAVWSRHPHAAPVRCHPQSFELSTRIPVDGDQEGSTGRSITIGMSPGSDQVVEPHFLVYPQPSLEGVQPPTLEIGRWETEGWFGAVLTSADLQQANSPEEQCEQVDTFLRAAIEAHFALLGAAPVNDHA